MASLDALPADQRAVLQLLLQRGHSYDEIARLLSLHRAAVRKRALAAFDALGGYTRTPAERRTLITDYLLGQLSEPESEEMREHLAGSASERRWAQRLLVELAPLATSALPEIPLDAAASRDHAADAGRASASEPERPGGRRGLRLGGAVLVAAAVVVVVIVLTAGAKVSALAPRADSGIAYASIVRHTNVAAVAAGESKDKILGDEGATYSLTAHRAGPSTFKLTSTVIFTARPDR